MDKLEYIWDMISRVRIDTSLRDSVPEGGLILVHSSYLLLTLYQ